MPQSIQVMLVEDSPEYRESITLAAEREDDIELCSQFGTAEEAIRSLANMSSDQTPDVILLDLNLPGLSGIEAIPLMSQMIAKPRILILTQSDREADVLAAISAGAIGYLLKGTTRREIFQGIRIAVNDGASIDPALALYIFNALNIRSKKPQLAKALAKRELEILSLLSTGMVQKEIGDKLGISNNTVATHIRRIYEKLNVNNAPSAIAKAYRDGILR